MENIICLLVLLLCLSATSSRAAVLVFSSDGTYVTKPTLSIASTAADVSGQTVVVTLQQVVTTAISWPADRALRFESGGYVTFTGSGALTGLKEAKPEYFGINTTPGTTNMTAAFQAALNAAPRVILGSTTYLVDTLNLNSGNDIGGSGNTSIILQNKTSPHIGGGTLSAVSSSTATYVTDIRIHDLQLLGQVATQGFSEQSHLISLAGTNNVTIENCLVKGFRGDGVYIADFTPISDQSLITSANARHNKDVHIVNNTFDGVNQANRQCITGDDVDGIIISNNVFKNSTSSSMPGAIDFEPAYSWGVVRNVKIANNSFDNIGPTNRSSAGGVISLILGIATVTQPKNFIITGNDVTNTTRPFLQVAPGSYAPWMTPLNLVVANNTSSAPAWAVYLEGTPAKLWGATIHNNIFAGQIALGYASGQTLLDVNISNNSIIGGTPLTAITLCAGSNLQVKNNILDGYTAQGIVVGTSDHVDITGNTFVPTGLYSVVRLGESTISGSSSVYLNNSGGAGHNFPAWRTDDCGIVTNTDTAVSFNLQTLPDSFPVGRSMAILEGNTKGYPPGTGATKGTLLTYRPRAYYPSHGYIYQELYFYNAGAALGNYYFRRSQPDGFNAWESWVLK